MVVKLFIGNDKLDLFKDENITVTSTITDASDISKNVGDYSKTFTVPASATNNRIFKHWYNADVDNTFDARTKVAGRIELDGLPFKVGQWRLSKVSVKSNYPSSYTINFFGRLVSFKNLFKNDELSALDLSAYNHEYNETNVLTGLQSELFGGAIKYNLLTKKRFIYDGDPTNDTDTDLITNIAFNGQDVGVRFSSLQPSIKVLTIIEQIETDYGITFSREFFGRPEFSDLYMWVNREKNEDDIAKVAQVVSFTGGSGDFGFIDPVTSIATFNIEPSSSSTAVVYIENFIRIFPEVGFEDFNYDVVAYVNGVEVAFDSYTGDMVDPLRAPNLFAFGTYEVYFEIRAESTFQFQSTWYQRVRRRSGVVDVYDTFSLINTVSGGFSISANLPKIKIIDFLKGIFSAFKLIVIPTSDTEVYVNTLKDYYSQGRLVDVTRYVDFDKVDVKRGDILNDIKFNFQEPQTILNEQFLANTGLAYGDEELLLSDADGEPLDGKALTVKLPFENMVYERLTDAQSNLKTNVMYGAVIDADGETTNIKPHIFYNYQQTLGIFRIGWFDTPTSVVPLSTINMAIHSNNLDTKDFVFNFSSEFSNWDGQLMTNTLYKNYYEDYVTSIFNIKRRDWIFKCILPLNILAALQLNDIIQIQERYYRISKFDLNLTTGESTLNLINSFDNTINPFSAGQTVFWIDGNERLLSTYISGNDEFTVDKNDAGYGIGWVDVTIEGRNIFMQVDQNDTGLFRTINLLVENVAKTKTIDIVINQFGGIVTVDNNVITVDSNLITVDNG